VIIVMPVKDRDDMTDQFIDRYSQQVDCEAHPLHILDNGSTEPPRWMHVHDTAGLNIHQQWNWALDHLVRPIDNVCFVNNDIRLVDDHTFGALEEVLTDMSIGVVSPNHGHPTHAAMQQRSGSRVLYVPPAPAHAGGPAGFCFAVPPRVHHRFRFHEPFQRWFGDTDLFWTVHYLYGLHCTVDMATAIEHIDGGSQSSKHLDLADVTAADRVLFEQKWRLT